MHEKIGITADRRREVGVAAERQAEVPCIGRAVIGLRLAAQHGFHDQRLFGRIRHILEHAVEQARRDDLTQRELAPLTGEIFLERHQLFAARRLVDAVDDRRSLCLQRLGGSDIGGDHEILHHAVRIEPFAYGDFLDHAFVVKPHLPLRQFEVERVARLAGLEQQFPRAPQVLQIFGRLACIDRRLRVFIGDVAGQTDNGAGKAPVADPAFRVDADVTGHGRTIHVFLETADVGAQHLGQHGDDAVGKIDRIAAFARFAIERAARADVIADIGNRDDGAITALPVRLGPDGIVMIAGIGRVDSDDGNIAQVFAVLARKRQVDRALRLGDGFLRKDMRDAMLGNRDQAESLGRQRIADHFDDLDLGAGGFAHALGQYQFAFRGLADIADGGGIAHALVDRGQPVIAATVLLDHAHQTFGARRQFLDRCSAPPAFGFFVPRKDAIAAFERGHLLAFLHHQPRRLFLGVGRPVFGLRNRLPILDRDDLEDGHLGHAAHAVIGRALAIDQAFFGHVLEALFQRDLFLPLEPEGLGDFALARRCVGGLDEFENLFFIRQSLGLPVLVLFCHARDMGTIRPHVTVWINTPWREARALPPVRR